MGFGDWLLSSAGCGLGWKANAIPEGRLEGSSTGLHMFREENRDTLIVYVYGAIWAGLHNQEIKHRFDPYLLQKEQQNGIFFSRLETVLNVIPRPY